MIFIFYLHRFSKLITKWYENEKQFHIYSYSINEYPLMICLTIDNGQFMVAKTITSTIHDEEIMFEMLRRVRDCFHP